MLTLTYLLALLQVRRLPVGDGIWIARHRYIDSEYVLDFIVERKNVADLRCSIRDNRYKDQKLRLLVFQISQCCVFISGKSSAVVISVLECCTHKLCGFENLCR